MSDEQQWIPVPAPEPYRPESAPRRGLAVASFALGLSALLTTVVATFYFSLFVILGAVLGLAALTLGVIALVTRNRVRWASITGLVAGGLSILLAITAGGFVLAALMNPSGQASGSGSGEAQPDTPQWAPGDPSEQLLEWPANMETGGFVFGPGAALRPSEPLAAGDTPVTLPVERLGGDSPAPNDVTLYVDYRCPHCAVFEQVNGELLQSALDDGQITLEVRPLSFVDRERSAAAAAAVACVADAQPEAAWTAHETLLSPATQTPSWGGSSDELISALDAAVGGLDASARDCIETSRFVPFASALNEWLLSAPVPNAANPSLTVTSTPTILVNGVQYEGSPEDPAAFAAFFESQLR